MTQRDVRGLEKAAAIYERRQDVARELAGGGRDVIGYLCYFAPPELIEAAGLVPVRMLGQMGGEVTAADNYTEPLGCPYIRNCFEQDLKGRRDFLSGMIIPHSCDSAQRIYGIWKHYRRPAYSYLFSVPHRTTPWSSRFFERELGFFQESLEKHTGHPISKARLEEVVRLYNDNRKMVADLYGLRIRPFPPVSGTEMFKLLVAGMILPAEEFNTLLKEVTKEVQQRGAAETRFPRILFWGCIADDAKLYELIESAGSVIVSDDTCIGTRSYLRQVDTSQGVMKGLTRAYFEDFKCPRTDRGPGLGRYDYLINLVRQYRADAVICYTLSFCDPHKLDYPDVRDYLRDRGVPSLLIDDDYSLSNRETVLSRLEAFFEMLV